MRPRYFLVNELLQELGRQQVSGQLGVSVQTTYKWGEDPEQSGSEIPVKHLVALLGLGRGRSVSCELVQHFSTPAGLAVFDQSAITEVMALLTGKNGNGKKEGTQTCHGCGEPVSLIAVCGSCKVGGRA